MPDMLLMVVACALTHEAVPRYMWPVIFGEPAVTEPVEPCDLLHCQPAAGLPEFSRAAIPATRELPY